MSDKIGDYKWHQISQWETTPANCVTKFVQIGDTKQNAQYLLIRVTKEIENGYQFEVCLSDCGVPDNVLYSKNTGYYRSINHKSMYVEMTPEYEERRVYGGITKEQYLKLREADEVIFNYESVKNELDDELEATK